MWEKERNSESLTSSTYLNVSTENEIDVEWKGGGMIRKNVERRTLSVWEIKEELRRLVIAVKGAGYPHYLSLRGEWTVLFRLLYPLKTATEARDAIRLAWLGRTPTKELAEIFKGGMQNMTDNAYLDFCGVGEIPPPWKLKTLGKVGPGNLVYCQEKEQWAPATIDQWSTPVHRYFTAELDIEEMPR